MSTVTLEKITKRFGPTTALSGVSLEANNREFIVILGPTGAGKTTLLRCVAGLEKMDAGAVFVDGENVNKRTPAERDLAFVFQNYALYPRKSVYKNIASPLEARNVGKEEMDGQIRKVAQVLHIEHLLTRYPVQLSGGEQQRVALGRAMVRHPHAFLMDEPLTNLDFKLRTEMRSELKRIQRELNETFLYVTNDQVEAMSMADKIAVLNKGVIQQFGPPREVYEHPANLFVAGFIGNPRMNLVRCSLDRNTSALVDAGGAWQLQVPDSFCERIVASGNTESLLFGVRPEDVTILMESTSIAGDVYVVEPLGDRNIYDIRLGTGIVKVKTPPTFWVQTGTQVHLTFDLDRAHVFDAKTEQTIF